MESMGGAQATCWRCGGDVVAGALQCTACEAPQPLAPGIDHFAILGLERGLSLDAADLERRFHAASRAVHPDRHQTDDARAQQLSVTAAAAVNRAYRTLRDPMARGKYWLELHGVRLNADNRVPPSLAALVFETQEQLEGLRDAGANATAAQREEIASVRDQLEQRLAAVQERIVGGFGADPSHAAAPANLDQLKTQLAEVNYLRTLLGDVEDALGEPRGTDRRH